MSARGGRFEPRRIVVVVTRQIGDVLLTTPLIAAAKARWPQAEVDVLGFAGTLAVLAGNPAVSSLIAMEPRSGFRRALPLVRRLCAATTWRSSPTPATVRTCSARSPAACAAASCTTARRGGSVGCCATS